MTLVLFCADWCSSCREFRSSFNALNADGLSKYWVDIDCDAHLLVDINIENLPTVLAISPKGSSWYFGAIPPNQAFLEKLLSDVEMGKIESGLLDRRLEKLISNLHS